MMKATRKILSMLLILSTLLLSLSGCLDAADSEESTTTTTTAPTSAYVTEAHRIVEKIHVPDLAGTDADSAKAILVNCGLVPVMAEEFSDYLEQGLVTRSEPIAFTEVEPGTRVTVFVSRGLSSIKASNFQYNWQNKFNSAPVTLQVEQIFVEEDFLYLDFSIHLGWYISSYVSPIDYSIWYFYFDNFSVNIDGNIIAATASGNAAEGYVERSQHNTDNDIYRMRVQIPLTASITHRPTTIEVFCRINDKQAYANGVGRVGESTNSYDYKFSAVNITW